MKKICILSLFLIEALLLSGCAQKEAELCKSPYIEYKAGECCLDKNNNAVCDKDEVKDELEAKEDIEEEVKACPVSCDDGNKCTEDICSEKTNFGCQNNLITLCCGNELCEDTENNENCESDCDPMFDIKIIDKTRDKTKIETIDLKITNERDKVIKSLNCNYELYDGKGRVRKRGVLFIAIDNKISDLGFLGKGETKEYTLAPYQEMYDWGPYKLNLICEEEIYSFNLKFDSSCDDGIQNQGEERIDCGGPCNQCAYGLEDVVVVDNIEFKVMNVEVKKSVGDEDKDYRMTSAKGRYWIIHLIIKNLDTHTRYLYPKKFLVVDSNDYSYDHDSNAEYDYTEYERGVDFDYKVSIPPTLQVDGYLIYDLPWNEDSAELGVYSVDGGEVKYITLK